MQRIPTQTFARLAALVVAITLAFIAQYLFTGEVFTRLQDSNTWEWPPHYSLATGLLCSALLCAIWALSLPDEHTATIARTQPTIAVPARVAWIIGSATGCSVAATAIYLLNGETDLVRMLWLISIVIIITPWWPKQAPATTLPALTRTIWLLIAGLTMVGFGLRVWELTELPAQVDNDVALMGTFARELIQTENYTWIGFSDSEHLRSYEQFLAWSMRLFGQHHAGLVSGSVIAGTLTIPLVFLLGRELFGTRVGLIAAALLAVNYTHLHFSRIMFGPVATFLAVAAIYCLFRGWRTQQRQWLLIAGLATGIGILMYYSSRVVPVILAALFLVQLFRTPRAWRTHLGNWIFVGLGALIGVGPMLAFAVTELNQFVGRGNQVML